MNDKVVVGIHNSVNPETQGSSGQSLADMPESMRRSIAIFRKIFIPRLKGLNIKRKVYS